VVVEWVTRLLHFRLREGGRGRGDGARGGRGGVGKASPSSRVCAKEVVVWVVRVMRHLCLACARGGKWWWWCG
jgi:hypothetical protein